MMTVGPILDALFRWLHVLFGVMWIGIGFFFSLAAMPFLMKLDPDANRRVVPELVPRAIFWFKLTSLLTYIFGLLLLMLVFYHGRLAFMNVQGPSGYVAPIVMILFTLVAAPFVYDVLVNSSLGKNPKVIGAVLSVLLTLVLLLLVFWAKFDYRTASIHVGAMIGSILLFNVWLRLVPAQRHLVECAKSGSLPDPARMGSAMLRARHNTYLGITIIWAMLSAHTFAFAGGALGMTENTWWIGFMVITLLGWHIVFQFFKRAGKLQGA